MNHALFFTAVFSTHPSFTLLTTCLNALHSKHNYNRMSCRQMLSEQHHVHEWVCVCKHATNIKAIPRPMSG